METASAGKHGFTGKSDCRTVGKQLGNGRNALRIMRAPERRHHHQMACDGEIRIARWLDVVAALNEIRGTTVEPDHDDARPGDVRHSHAAIDRAREVLGYKPLVDFETGLRRTVEFFAAEE